MNTQATPIETVSSRELRNQALAFEASAEGIVLLENKGVLPLEPCAVALYGAGASYTIAGGSGSGEVNVRHTVSVEEGLERYGFRIVTKDWIARYDRQWKAGKEAFLRKHRRKLWFPNGHLIADLMAAEYRYPTGDRIGHEEAASCGTDTCIYVVSRQAGEGHDCEDVAGSFRLDSTEEHNIRLCASLFKRFVLVINSGSPIDLSPIEGMAGIGAVVYLCQGGMEGGRALAAVLKGERTPSGKLAVTWPRRYSDVPFGEEYGRNAHKAYYKEGLYVGYRYYDSFGVEPRYAFGYGLSYTTFAADEAVLSAEGAEIRCCVKVRNTGSVHSGKEVVQVYVRCPGDDIEYQRLVAFGKTELLAPGESETVHLSFPAASLTRYEEPSARTVLRAGRYLVCVGFSSRETRAVGVLEVEKEHVIRQHKNLCPSAGHVAELSHDNVFPILSDLPVVSLDTAAMPTEAIDYNRSAEDVPEKVQATVKDFTVKDFIKFCTGTGFSGEKRGFRTPGSVGHTTTDYIPLGIRNAEMCDGPAGIRLEKRSVQYPNGDIRAMDLSISLYEFFPRFLLRWLVLGNPKKGRVLYQFVTGFPIEAAVAQTWNTSLGEQIGQAVSEEMSEYGVTFWLAPAMNIVRNPLCGRNYEYYSEDPLLTGMMASAVTRGAQCHPGNHATVKHFCVNNQESSRYTVSSEVDERVLREIYWKGFEIAVKESRPHALMTAYNKVNGVYCANNRELCTDLLRSEWQFDGVVMTDWMSTGEGKADEAAAIRAGVDIIMPGGKDEIKALNRAYERGELTAEELQSAAMRVLKSIL